MVVSTGAYLCVAPDLDEEVACFAFLLFNILLPEVSLRRQRCEGVHGVRVRSGVDEDDCTCDSIEGEEHFPRFEEWFEGCVEQMGRRKLGFTLDVAPFGRREGGGPDVGVGVPCVGLTFVAWF